MDTQSLLTEAARLRRVAHASQTAHDAKKRNAGITWLTSRDLEIAALRSWADQLEQKAGAL